MGFYGYDDDDDFDYLYEDENNDNIVDDVLDAYDDYRDLKDKLNEKTPKNVDTNKAANEIKNEVAKDAAKGTAKATGAKATADTASKASVNSGRAAEEVNAAKNAASAAETAGSAAAEGAAAGGTAAGAAAGGAAGGAAAGGAAAGGAAAGGAAAGGAAAGGAAAGGAAAGGAAGPPGWIALAVSVLADLAKKEHEKRKNESDDKKAKRFVREFAPIIALVSALFIVVGGIGLFFSVGQTVTTNDSSLRLQDYVECMQTDKVCSEILDLPMEEEIEGYNKPLITFNYKELKDLAKNYLKFSDKYFEFGEGLFSESYSEIAQEFGIEKSEDITKEQIDASILSNFLSLQARAFSKVHWIEVDPDSTEREITEFDYFYKTEEDYSDITKWFKWFSVDEYEIKIPLVSKYSVVSTKVSTSTTITDGGNSTSDSDVSEYTVPSEVTDEFKLKELKNYIEMVKDYLPDWFEPYSVYMATGSASYAKEYYNAYLKYLDECSIEVKLYKQDINYRVDTKVVTDYTSSNADGTTSGTSTSITNVVVHEEPYAKVVFKGPKALDYVLLDAGSYLGDSPAGKVEKLIDNQVTTFQGPITNDKGEVIGSYYSRTVTNSKKTTLPGKEVYFDDARIQMMPYSEEFKDTAYGKSDSKYINLRASVVYKKLCESKNVPPELADIGAALETIYDFYYNMDEINLNLQAIDISNTEGTYKEPAQSGTSDVKNGWASTNTTSSGITYRSYKQNQAGAYYVDLDYGGYGRFGSWGCPLTSSAIMLDMLGVHVDPYALYKKVGAQNPAAAINSYLGKTVYGAASPNKNAIIECVKAGKPVGIHVGYDHTSGNQHYMVITDYNPKTREFYVEGVHTAYKTGWRTYEQIREANTNQGIDVMYVPVN